MELRQFRYFVAVAEAGSVASAARTLHIAQPALSRQMAALEKEFGTPLFIRLARGVVLTRAGETFLEHAREVVASTGRIKTQVALAAKGKLGSLRLGVMPGYTWLPQLKAAVQTITAQAPETSVLIDFGLSFGILESLRRQELDAAIVAWRPPLESALTGFHVYRDRLMLAMPRDVAAGCSAQPLLSELAGQHFILFPRERSPSLFDDQVNALTRAGISLGRGGVSAADSPTVLGLVAAGLGCGLVPASYSRHAPDSVVMKEIRDLNIFIDMELVWRTDSIDPLTQAFVSAWQLAKEPPG